MAAAALAAAAGCARVTTPADDAKVGGASLDCRSQQATQIDYEAGAGTATRHEALDEYFGGHLPSGHRSVIDHDRALVRDASTGALVAIIQFEARPDGHWVVSFVRYCSDSSDVFGR